MHTNATFLTVLETPGTETLSVPVLRVFDGDGFLTKVIDRESGAEIEIGVRFGFIDAPEIGQTGGTEARKFLQSLIEGKWLDLVVLLKSDTGKTVDRHGRIVAIPYLAREPKSNSLLSSVKQRFGLVPSWNIELEMILNGWAWVLERYGPDDRYLDALDDARLHRRGIWALDSNIPPWEFKRRQYRAKVANRTSPKPDLFQTRGGEEDCPRSECDGRLRVREGKFGKFIGCSNFPKCRHSRNLS